MGEDLADWLQRNADRVAAQQRSTVDTAKVLVSLTLAVAATLVATALQVAPVSALDVAATIVLAVTLLASIAVVLLDRLTEPDRHAAEARRTAHGWTDDRMLEELRDLALDAESENTGVVRQVRKATEVQVVLSIVAGTLAAISLLLVGQ